MGMSRLLLVVVLASTAVTAFSAPGDITLTTPTVACPKTQVGDEQLQAKYNAMWEKYEKAIKSEAAAVADEIGRLYESAKAKGNLDLVLFWDGFKKSFSDSGRIHWENSIQRKDWSKRFQEVDFPDEFAGVLRKCESGLGEAKTDLEDAYKALIAELTKKDKLEEALAIRTELGGLWKLESEAQQKEDQPNAARNPRPQKALLERMAGKWSRFGTGIFYQLHPNGNAEVVDRGTNRVLHRVRMNVISPESVEAAWDNGYKDHFFPAGDDIIAVINWTPAGKRDSGFVLERIK